jgi:hypothetical protein
LARRVPAQDDQRLTTSLRDSRGGGRVERRQEDDGPVVAEARVEVPILEQSLHIPDEGAVMKVMRSARRPDVRRCVGASFRRRCGNLENGAGTRARVEGGLPRSYAPVGAILTRPTGRCSPRSSGRLTMAGGHLLVPCRRLEVEQVASGTNQSVRRRRCHERTNGRRVGSTGRATWQGCRPRVDRAFGGGRQVVRSGPDRTGRSAPPPPPRLSRSAIITREPHDGKTATRACTED